MWCSLNVCKAAKKAKLVGHSPVELAHPSIPTLSPRPSIGLSYKPISKESSKSRRLRARKLLNNPLPSPKASTYPVKWTGTSTNFRICGIDDLVNDRGWFYGFEEIFFYWYEFLFIGLVLVSTPFLINFLTNKHSFENMVCCLVLGFELETRDNVHGLELLEQKLAGVWYLDRCHIGRRFAEMAPWRPSEVV